MPYRLIALLALTVIGFWSATLPATVSPSFKQQQLQHEIKLTCPAVCTLQQKNWCGCIESDKQGHIHMTKADYESMSDYQCACTTTQPELHNPGFDDERDAQDHCPDICEQATFQGTQEKGMTWTGDWWHVDYGAKSACLCKKPFPQDDEPEEEYGWFDWLFDDWCDEESGCHDGLYYFYYYYYHYHSFLSQLR